MLVKSQMSKKVVTIPPDTSILRAIEIMREKSIRHLPVVKEGELVGLWFKSLGISFNFGEVPVINRKDGLVRGRGAPQPTGSGVPGGLWPDVPGEAGDQMALLRISVGYGTEKDA